MVPFLNTVGTDVACVGVSMATYPACMYTANLSRTTILILEWPNFAIWQVNVISLGCWQTFLIQRWEMTPQSPTAERPAC